MEKNSRKFTFDDSLFYKKRFSNTEEVIESRQSNLMDANDEATVLSLNNSDVKNLRLFLEKYNNKSKKESKEEIKEENKEERKKNKTQNLLLILNDKPFTKKDLNSLIDLASFLKTDIITYFCNFNKVEDLRKTIKNRILINKIFLHFLLKNKYNLSTSKINFFIMGQYTSSLESLISIFYLQKIRKGDYLRKIKVKGLILENSIYLKETINFLFPQFNQKFIVPTFFIFGKFSVFSSEFLKEFNPIKTKFANLSEWLPEGGDMSNINNLYRSTYFKKLKKFIKKFENFKFKNGILLKNKNGIDKNYSFKYKKNFKEDCDNDISLVDFNKRKSFIVNFDMENLTLKEKNKIKETLSLRRKVSDYFKKISRKSSIQVNKKFEEKEYENETVNELTIEKHFELE